MDSVSLSRQTPALYTPVFASHDKVGTGIEFDRDIVVPGEHDYNNMSRQMREMQKQSLLKTAAGSSPVVEKRTVPLNNDRTMEVGTFNVNWLGSEEAAGLKPRTEEDYRDMANIIRESGVEAVGLEEVGTEEALQKLITYLPGFDYLIGTTGMGSEGKSQRIAMLYNADKVQCDKDSFQELREVMVGDKTKAPIAVKMKAGEFDFTFVVTHMKARFDKKAVAIRNEMCEKLSGWIEKQVEGGNKNIIVVGDFNDKLGSPALGKFDSQLYFVSQEAADNGLFSNIPFESLIDHIGATTVKGGAMERFVKGSVNIPDIGKYPGYTFRISDHKLEHGSFDITKENNHN